MSIVDMVKATLKTPRAPTRISDPELIVPKHDDLFKWAIENLGEIFFSIWGKPEGQNDYLIDKKEKECRKSL